MKNSTCPNDWESTRTRPSANEHLHGSCPVCGAPIFAPIVAHIVGPVPVRATCTHVEAMKPIPSLRITW